jgi:hypothetical protein
LEESLSRMNGIIATLFHGTPLTRGQREQMRKPTTLDEKQAFCWRLLCEAAFQEDDRDHDFLFPPLARVNFDFRSNSLQKWTTAIDALFITFSGVEVDKKEKSLASGAIDERAYADKSQHGRIQAVKKQVSTLRKLYGSTWDANSLAQDQRCIYAICSNEKYGGYGHRPGFVEDFVKELFRQHPGVNLADPKSAITCTGLWRHLTRKVSNTLFMPIQKSVHLLRNARHQSTTIVSLKVSRLPATDV